MIRSIIQAGFGNQLFQYATAYALARKLGQPLELDVSFYSYIQAKRIATPRTNNLSTLALDNPRYVDEPRSYWKYRLSARFGWPRSLHIDGMRIPIVRENVAECRLDQSHLFENIGPCGAVLYGFWQNTVYFDDYLQDLKRQFRPRYELSAPVAQTLENIRKTESVGVHVRRGDFVVLGWDKGAEYYRRSMDLLRQRLPNVRFFVVSDDREWVRQHLLDQADATLIDAATDTRDVDEFFLLSSCKHQIICESTFGWWAAYLNTHSLKEVIIPKNAVGGIFPKAWTRL